MMLSKRSQSGLAAREHSCWSWSDWGSFISSVAVDSDILSLILSFGFMKISDFYSVKVMFCA